MAVTNAPVTYTGTAGLTPQEPNNALPGTGLSVAPGASVTLTFTNRTSFLMVQNQQASGGAPFYLAYGQGGQSSQRAATTADLKIDAGDAAFSLPVGADWASILLDASASVAVLINNQALGIRVTSLV